jgi:hypothetical protein
LKICIPSGNPGWKPKRFEAIDRDLNFIFDGILLSSFSFHLLFSFQMSQRQIGRDIPPNPLLAGCCIRRTVISKHMCVYFEPTTLSLIILNFFFLGGGQAFIFLSSKITA